MAYGLQVFDSSGNLEIDTTTRVMSLYAIVSLTLPTPTSTALYETTVSVPGVLPNGEFSGYLSTNRCKVEMLTDMVKISIYPYYHVSNTGSSGFYYSFELADLNLYIFRF